MFQKRKKHDNKKENDEHVTAWIASNDHSCSKDLHEGAFSVAFNSIDVVNIRMEHRVNGPEKDCLSLTKLLPCCEWMKFFVFFLA